VEKNEQRWQSLNPNDGKGGALMLGGGHSATGGSGGKAATCFGVREKHGRGKGRRGCLSGCYEWGGERTGSGTGTVAMWRRREGGGRSAWHAHKQGPPTGSGVGAMEAGSGRARGTEQSGERRGPVGWAPSGRERGAWAAPGTYGLAEEKEGAGPSLIEQCQFRFKTNF
jgi:hypothetical protein